MEKNNKQTGWVSIFRSLKNKGYYNDSEYVHLWIHLLLSVNYEESEFLWNDKIIKVKQGQFITGRKRLSFDTGINESKIERILKCFESEQQIEQQKTTKYRLITILKWKSYQDIDNKMNSKRTTSEQQVNTNNNNNKDNKDIYTSEFESFWKEYPKKSGKVKAYTYWKQLSSEECLKVMEDIPLRMSDDKWKNGFIKDPERYLKYRQWEDEIKVIEKTGFIDFNKKIK